MVTILDCIRREPLLLEAIIDKRETIYTDLFAAYPERAIAGVVLIGSGTSYTAAATARYLLEKASGLHVQVALPNEFLRAFSAPDPRTLYVFLSQTGTSSVTLEALKAARERGLMTACLTEHGETPIARKCPAFIPIGCGHEEYGIRTIGYSASVLTLMLLGVSLGIRRGTLSYAAADAYIAQAKAAVAHIPTVTDAALAWMDAGRRVLMRAGFIAFTGAQALHGVALEAAIKVWEAPWIASAGYELDEGTHGPNFGYGAGHALVVLNAGGHDEAKALAVAEYMKRELGAGHIIGVGAKDEFDLAFTPAGGECCCLEFAVAVQVMMYRLATDGGRDLTKRDPHTVMNGYFRSHSDQPLA